MRITKITHTGVEIKFAWNELKRLSVVCFEFKYENVTPAWRYCRQFCTAMIGLIDLVNEARSADPKKRGEK